MGWLLNELIWIQMIFGALCFADETMEYFYYVLFLWIFWHLVFVFLELWYRMSTKPYLYKMVSKTKEDVIMEYQNVRPITIDQFLQGLRLNKRRGRKWVLLQNLVCDITNYELAEAHPGSLQLLRGIEGRDIG